MSKMDGKPDDVHDKEYHTMIKGLLSDKEFRKTLPAGLNEDSQKYLARKLQHRYIVSTFYPFPKAKQPRTGSLPGSDLVPLQTNDLTLVSYNPLRWIINSESISHHWVYCDLGYQSDMAPYPYNLQMIDSSPLKSL
ncbi:hypothetical protein PPACK8108_LOCUS8467 [Phakopsora pachyrhizi]|uniref:Uncharacterized protein n=1 Tax=Phakopsora pachyrhizi TaxID=170000 RepID=A0AAV0AXH6_PHAPC|nr:hypothetical protein PPACK8108_LOCUS8467 [Phakopsora pachyrhizi]